MVGVHLPLTVRVLADAGALRRVLTGYLLYVLVEVVIWLAVLLWAYDEGGARLAGLVAVVQLLPAASLAPLLASLGDRTSRGTALMLAHLLVAATTALTAAALLLEAAVWLVVAASATATTAISVVRPLHFAALPQLVRRPDDLVAANALSSVGDGVALFVGPLVAGAGAQAAGPGAVLALATLLAVVASGLCSRTGLSAGASPRSGGGTGWRVAFTGLGSLARDRVVLVLLLVLAVKFVVEGAHDVLGVSYAAEGLELGDAGAGMVIGALGLGSLVGGAVAATVATRPALAPVVLAGGLVLGVAIAAVSLTVVLAPALVLLSLAGAGGAVLMVAGRTLLQRTADQGTLARVFAVQEGTSLLGLAAGAAMAPYLVDLLSAQHAFLPLGLGVAALITLCHVAVRRLDVRAVLLPEETSLLRAVPFLSVLPAYEVEHLARHAVWVDVRAGDDVVREGEPGDRFYVVADGTLAVTVAGERRHEPLGPGAGFGEVALLRTVPRTATVTALADARLLALESADFLAAVTGSPDGRAVAAEVTAAHLERDAQR